MELWLKSACIDVSKLERNTFVDNNTMMCATPNETLLLDPECVHLKLLACGDKDRRLRQKVRDSSIPIYSMCNKLVEGGRIGLCHSTTLPCPCRVPQAASPDFP